MTYFVTKDGEQIAKAISIKVEDNGALIGKDTTGGIDWFIAPGRWDMAHFEAEESA